MADEKDLSDEIARGVTKALDEREKKASKNVAIGCGCLVVVPILIAICVAIFGEPAGVNVTSDKYGGVRITRDEYGEKWPFTVDEGILNCEIASAVVLRVGGTTYGVNGLGANRYGPIDPIWRDHPSAAEDPRFKGRKVNMGPIIDRGLLLCE